MKGRTEAHRDSDKTDIARRGKKNGLGRQKEDTCLGKGDEK